MNLSPLVLSLQRTLTLQSSSHPNRYAHLGAASGLVQVGDWLYVVSDDENHLGIFNNRDHKSGFLLRLFPGDLPLSHEERKAVKPDLEVLTLIPASTKYSYGALLALGSGSKENRAQGVIISLNDQDTLHPDLEIINLAGLYHQLKKEIGKLNIEGAVIVKEDIILFQRGNKKNHVNASIRFPLKKFYQYIFSANDESAEADDKNKHKLDTKITHYDLGELNGIPLCFTDATPLPNGAIVFTAAAENTTSSYLDGVCMGSVIGIIDVDGELQSLHPIDIVVKLEGITATLVDNKIQLLLVTDADDEATAAQLYSAEIIGYPFT